MLKGLCVTRGVRHAFTSFSETFPQFGNCPTFGGDTCFSCERADKLRLQQHQCRRRPGINKAKQEMTVFLDGIEKYHWSVSTGRAGCSTHSELILPPL